MLTRYSSKQPIQDMRFDRFSKSKIQECKSRSKTKRGVDQQKEINHVWDEMNIKNTNRWSSKMKEDVSKETPLKLRGSKTSNKKNVGRTTTTKKTNKKINKKEEEEMVDQQEQIQEIKTISKKLFPKKQKKIKKVVKKQSKVLEYRSFYKYYYSNLKDEHPNWTSSKITTIISLLWKKKKMSLKYESEQETVKEVCERILSGKDAFKESKKEEGISAQQIDKLWSRLPVEAKRKWQLIGNEHVNDKTDREMKEQGLSKTIIKGDKKDNIFGFLGKMIL